MKHYTTKHIIITEESHSSDDYCPRVMLRVHFVELDDAGNETDRGCKDLSSKHGRQFATERWAKNYIVTESVKLRRIGDSFYPEAEWRE